MKLLYKLFLVTLIHSTLFASIADKFLVELQAKQEKQKNITVKKDNEEITYFTKKKEKIKNKKVYKGKYLLKDTNYSPYTSFKTNEDEYKYDYNKSSNKYIEKISRTYNEEGYLIEEYKFGIVSNRPTHISTTKYNRIGNLLSIYINQTDDNNASTYTEYNDFGRVFIKKISNSKEKYIAMYNDYGSLKKEEIYTFANITKKTIVKYDKYGKLKSEIFYKDDKYISKSLCSFKTNPYLRNLEKKYIKEIKGLKRRDNQCLKVNKNKYILMIPYVNYHKNYTQFIIGIVNKKNKNLKGSFFGKNTKFNNIASKNYIQRISYLSNTNNNIFELGSDIDTNTGDSILNFNSYKITQNNNIVKLKTPTFNLNDIQTEVKNGRKFNTNLLNAMMIELPISKQNVKQYSSIALQLQNHKFHEEAIAIFTKIKNRFPKRANVYLHLANSWSVVESLEMALFYYNKYESLMKNQNNGSKISKKVQEIIINGKKNYLKSLNIGEKIVKIDDKYSQIIFTGYDDLVLKVKYLNSVKIKNRIIITDIDFDNRSEVLVDVSSDINSIKYKVFGVEYGYIYPYPSLNTLGKFTLNQRDETLIEYTNTNINTYCKDSRYEEYYLCKQEIK